MEVVIEKEGKIYKFVYDGTVYGGTCSMSKTCSCNSGSDMYDLCDMARRWVGTNSLYWGFKEVG